MPFFRPKNTSHNRIVIYKDHILHNYEWLQKQQPQAELFPVVKSNAYGHGVEPICKILNNTEAKMLCVTSYEEAKEVLKHTKKWVLILGELPHKTYKICDMNRMQFIVYNAQTLKFLSKYGKKAKVHIFVNTGMNREGIQDVKTFLVENEKYLSKITLAGLCSHLAEAEEASPENAAQEKRFFQALEMFHHHKLYPKWIHLGNSCGTFILNDKRLNAFRPGIHLYGYNFFPEDHPRYEDAQKLKPGLQIFSTVVNTQQLQPGDRVSYSGTFTAEEPITTAIIPFGYHEGLDRRLNNKGIFRLHDFQVPVVGNVCMNISCLYCEDHKIKVGDEVELISPDPEAVNSVQHLATLMQTITYEVLVKLRPEIFREIK